MFKYYLHHTFIFYYKVVLGLYVMNRFFYLKKIDFYFSRYLDFSAFVKSTNFKICDVILDIAWILKFTLSIVSFESDVVSK